MYKNFKLNNGTYLYPMEIPRKGNDPAEKMDRETVITDAKSKGYNIAQVRVGGRTYEAVLVPVTEDVFWDLMRDDDKKQKSVRIDGRCMIGNGKGVLIRCPERVLNPRYGEEGQPKTLKVDCATCDKNTFDKPDFYMMSLSHSGAFNEDGEEYNLEIPCGMASEGDLYEIYCRETKDFVKKNYPKNLNTMEKKLQENSDTETAKDLDIHRNTVRNQVNTMKEDLIEMLDNLSAIYRK